MSHGLTTQSPPPLEPLLLEPLLSRRLWGGDRLGPLARIDVGSDPMPVGELWTAYSGNRIVTGAYAGRCLEQLVVGQGEALLGSAAVRRYGKRMPLLAKFIDAAAPLSIQVHPDDAYASTVEAASGHLGKGEAWYVLAADEDAEIVWGWRRSVSVGEVAAAVEADTLETLVNRVSVAPGTVVYNPPGLVHAIGAGILVFEIQQDSDLTYRLYDYGRRDAGGRLRELHVDKALAVADLSGGQRRPQRPDVAAPGWSELVRSPFFVLERLGPTGSSNEASTPHSLAIITVADGAITLQWGEGSLQVPVGSSVVVPALLGPYSLVGDAIVLRSTVPAADAASPGGR